MFYEIVPPTAPEAEPEIRQPEPEIRQPEPDVEAQPEPGEEYRQEEEPEQEDPELNVQQNGITHLTEFGYSGLGVSIEWEDNWRGNTGALGGYWLSFTLVGDIRDVAAVLIWSRHPSPWDRSDLGQRISTAVSVWSDSIDLSYSTFVGEISSGFPVRENELGTCVDVLLVALNSEGSAVGYVVVPVSIPAA